MEPGDFHKRRVFAFLFRRLPIYSNRWRRFLLCVLLRNPSGTIIIRLGNSTVVFFGRLRVTTHPRRRDMTRSRRNMILTRRTCMAGESIRRFPPQVLDIGISENRIEMYFFYCVSASPG